MQSRAKWKKQTSDWMASLVRSSILVKLKSRGGFSQVFGDEHLVGRGCTINCHQGSPSTLRGLTISIRVAAQQCFTDSNFEVRTFTKSRESCLNLHQHASTFWADKSFLSQGTYKHCPSLSSLSSANQGHDNVTPPNTVICFYWVTRTLKGFSENAGLNLSKHAKRLDSGQHVLKAFLLKHLVATAEEGQTIQFFVHRMVTSHSYDDDIFVSSFWQVGFGVGFKGVGNQMLCCRSSTKWQGWRVRTAKLYKCTIYGATVCVFNQNTIIPSNKRVHHCRYLCHHQMVHLWMFMENSSKKSFKGL